ncbi:MAG: GTP cyclohydrolase II [uncultured bacterium]|uniref:GTP cyclohydrolase-2 n=1 Tax=Candidatus Daviesbacteria bacterium GW2011_GWC2_40_12 TaxID=1618431 RepID=A0A0G0QVW1_9BACT|nr:MAG: GTP cyclohydrolase II [uncultured bacterium]KKQ82875.1 MAG: GTP cyclohydrolase II [Candidatus Daviesbacteria bacterium GW2011_GWF2_38_7]KKR16003.1 MAG: GTP cyclohydrolase II [Candidatus Daviesbacteria bacterium GW2011_GWA2_39_33]KKR23448.1 MAG: GTP cyclohydrolase II [Candidatus Daviesbacteria bacterium GW2011_GWB1_39_5]KKR41491.1 MAG: GTP cyclohydrolase II [Candidatus Daviesbacteria bacterium GW2011_GWC2_40_12]OGE21864.1 MAG: GTP cyclohydrolase II [Candidatus Daviesbacteria bacterium R
MKRSENTIVKVASVKLPTSFGTFKVIIFKGIKDKLEHVVLLKGENFKNPVLTRIHSSCLTGDVFSSLKCDCRDQLAASLTKIGKSKNGLLIYLNQEGRGIGLINKIKAYALQEKGYDTVAANEQLGFAADTRNYNIAAQILKDLNIDHILLLTNNPDKVTQLKQSGITVVKAIPLEITPNNKNRSYLKTKKDRLGHKLSLV